MVTDHEDRRRRLAKRDAFPPMPDVEGVDEDDKARRRRETERRYQEWLAATGRLTRGRPPGDEVARRPGSVAVPTGTREKPPKRYIYGPDDPRGIHERAFTPTDIPGVQRLVDILAGPEVIQYGPFKGRPNPVRALGTAFTTPLEEPAVELQKAHPVLKILMGLPIGAPVASLAGTAGRGVLTQTGRAATQVVEKAAPVARRLATEEVGAVGKAPKKPITKPAAAEALSPAAKRLYLEDEGLVEVERGVSQRNIRIATIAGDEWQVMITQYEPAMGSAQIDVARLKLAGKRVLSGFAKEHGVSLSRQEMNEVLEFIHKVDPQIVKLYGQRGGRTVLYPMPAAKPAQATEGVAKEPWQMTYREYSDSLSQGVVGGENAKHIRIINQALKEKKPVPPEVLAEYPEGTFTKAPVGAGTRPVSESVEQIAATGRPGAAPTGARVVAGEAAAPPGAPPGKPPAATGDVPPVDPILPRPRTLADMNREAKGMRAMTPEQRAAVMDVAKPIEGDILYQARPFNEHAKNLLGPETGFMKALRGVPGVRRVFGAWNPAAMSRDNPVAMIGLRQSIFQEIEKSRIKFATLRWWNDAKDAFDFKRSGTTFGLRPTSGIWKATKVQPSSPSVARGKMFGTINDIIEHPERYSLNDAQKRVLALADNTLTQGVRDAQRAGVNVVELAEAYWPRSVIQGPKGGKGFAGIRRRVSGAKGYTHQRVFADVDDLVEAGFEVETDPRRVFASRLEAGVDTIAQANARKQIAGLPGVEKPLERMTRKFPEVLESAREARVARDAAKVIVVKAGAKATPEEVMALRQAEADFITAQREVFAKKVEAGTPGYYELRLPSGRIAPQELVEQVGKFIDLPELQQAGTGGAARLTQEISQLLRVSLTNVDLAAGFIQGQALFYRNNIAWWKAQGHAIVSLIDDPTAFVAKNFDLIDEGVRTGAIAAPTEFLFAKQGIASIPLRIPYAGPALGSFNRAFEWFITAGQTELFKAARLGKYKAAGMDELVSLGSAIRKEVGTESYAILGVKANQKTMEALMFFAGRFFRANVGLLGQSFTPGPGGAEARKAVGSLIAGGTALTIGINWAQNKKMPNMTDPYAPDWMQFKLGKTYFSAFGPMYPYFRTLARMGVALGKGDVMKAATQAKQFLQSKESLPLRAIDIGGQLIYYGSANVYGTKIEKTWASVVKGILSEFVTPISLQEIPSGFAEGRPEAALEFGGLVGRPKRVASEWYKELQAYRDIPSNPQEVKARKYETPGKVMKTREEYRKANPEIDAKLFITGQVGSLLTYSSKIAAIRLMRENGIRTEDIRSLEEKPYESTDKASLRRFLRLALGENVKAPVTKKQPTPSRIEQLMREYGLDKLEPVGTTP